MPVLVGLFCLIIGLFCLIVSLCDDVDPKAFLDLEVLFPLFLTFLDLEVLFPLPISRVFFFYQP